MKMKSTAIVIGKEVKDDQDYLVKCIGAFGLHQAIIVIIAGCTRFFMMVSSLSIVFLTPKTVFRCIQFDGGNDFEATNGTCYNNCTEYEYYETLFEDTLISRFGLICDDAWKASFTQSMIMFGIMSGATLFGWISDRYGRRPAFRLTTLVAVVFMIAPSFAPDYWTFTTLRFFCGLGTGGVMGLAVIVSIEVIGPNYKYIVGFSSIFPDGFFIIMMAMIAYFSTTWNIFLLACGLISVLHMIAVLTVPESARWLVSQRRGDDAVEALTYIAKFNNKETSHIRAIVSSAIDSVSSDQTATKASAKSFADLFRTRQMALITCCSVSVWLLSGICFFGIGQYATLLGTNVFIVSPLCGVVTSVGASIMGVMNKFFKRKTCSMLAMGIVSASMLILIFLPDGHWTAVLVALAGLSSSSGIFSVIYVHTNELYPTPLRNMGFGLCSAGSKLGAMIAPFIANTSPQWLASAMFAVMPLAAIGFNLLVPETKGKKLKDTID